MFSVEQQLSFKVSDHATKLFAKMFPDSQIAAKLSCVRTKTKAMVCSVIADELKNSTVSAMKSGSFSLLTNDIADNTNNKNDAYWSGILTALLVLLKAAFTRYYIPLEQLVNRFF